MWRWKLIIFALLMSCALQKSTQHNPWEKVHTPSPGAAKSIGSYSGGCLAGGVALPPSGEGHQLMALARGRYYGHPKMLAYIERLGKKVANKYQKTLAVGDISMPRGGMFSNGAHGSHQNGLDVDLWFELLPPQELPLDQRDSWPIQVVVDQPDALNRQLNIHWIPDIEELLIMAAEDSEVERIFVNPAIKKFFCQKYPEKNGGQWARKLRAWWGHHEHLHVRLTCPGDSPECQVQTSPEGDGCQEIDWWWSEDYIKSTEERKALKKEIVPLQILDACKFLL
ncbi:MAG: penicillin-insensitive murein endopeptidase [Bdellovibrio sp.]|nr:penicillin-insensitive murein endopeptidase [Bdellovibrio sp.]